MSEPKHTPGIGRIGTFLYEIDLTGRENLWSGSLSANNGHSPEHAERAAAMFAAAPEMYEALRCAQNILFLLNDEVVALGASAARVREMVHAAICKARAGSQP